MEARSQRYDARCTNGNRHAGSRGTLGAHEPRQLSHGSGLSPKYQRVIEERSFQSLVSHGPWPHFVLDGLIEEEAFASLQARLLEPRGDFILKEDHPAKLQLRYMMDLELAGLFFSRAMRDLLEGIAQSTLRPNRELAIQLRQMTPESPEFAPHVDLIERPSLVALYHVAPDWQPGRGGELVLLPNDDSSHPARKPIAPLPNRLVLFQSSGDHWHMVRKVQDWTRLMVLTEWLTEASA